MKFTYKWLTSFLETNLSAQEISSELTKLGLELENIIDRNSELSPFKVALIEDAIQHPNADKLRICKVNTGSEILQIVCGAPNARKGIKVVLAPVGTNIPNGNFKIKSSEIRGEKSNGMLCSYDELLIPSKDSSGIIELQDNAMIGDEAISYLGQDDVIFDVSVTPNRGDWLGVYGIARDLAAKNLGALKSLEKIDLEENFITTLTAKSESDECKLISFREIKDLNNKESPEWIKNLLNSVGITPQSAIVDITNFISISFARPLHAYDAKKIDGNLVAKNISGKEKFLSLNGKEYELSNNELVISDNNSICSLAGVIGGENSKCEISTNHIILESALFDKISVAKSGRLHQINTDSRARFERGIDEESTLYFLDYAAKMITEICGGKISTLSVFGNLPKADTIKFDTNLTEKRIGLSIPIETTKKIISDLGFTILEEDNNHLLLKIPSWRHDINCPEIIAEEIIRIYGFEFLQKKEIQQESNFDRLLTPVQRRNELLRSISASLGYYEVITWSFMPSKDITLFSELNDSLKIINPISSDLDYMRPTILPNLLKHSAYNLNRSINNIGFFEIGHIFEGINPSDEKSTITGLLAGNIIEKSHSDTQKIVDLFEIKSHIEAIISESGLDCTKMAISKDSKKYYHPGRSGSYKLGKNIIAYFGEIHPLIKEHYGISAPIYGFEIMLDNFPAPKSKFGKKAPISLSQYQSVRRDFAFLIDKNIQAGEIIRNISNLNDLIKEVDIFDLYQGKELPEGKISIAIKIILQSHDKTLVDEEIESISKDVINLLASKFAATLR